MYLCLGHEVGVRGVELPREGLNHVNIQSWHNEL